MSYLIIYTVIWQTLLSRPTCRRNKGTSIGFSPSRVRDFEPATFQLYNKIHIVDCINAPTYSRATMKACRQTLLTARLPAAQDQMHLTVKKKDASIQQTPILPRPRSLSFASCLSPPQSSSCVSHPT
jgi:hypothetical protein